MVANYRIKGIKIMNIPEIKEILRQASVEVDIQGRKHLALFESDFERVAIELVKKLTLTDVSQQRELFNAILDFSEELPMCTEDYHRGELWEKYKALNCG
jgi:hypothetical protein